MPDEKKYTERDLKLAERAAFKAGVVLGAPRRPPMSADRCYICGMPDEFADLYADGGSNRWRCSDEELCAKRAVDTHVRSQAKLRYPLPKVRRPRIVSIPGHGEWSFIAAPREDALLMHRSHPDFGWVNSHPTITPDIAAKLAPLFAEPLETVEDPDDA